MKLIPIEDWKTIDPDLVAVELAKESKASFKLGALICDKKGRIVASGYNKLKSHPRFGSGYSKNLHAEGAALLQAYKLNIDCTGFSMYVFRKNSCISKPCKDCQKLIEKAGIKIVYYSVKKSV